jgi:hypothetical protein
MTDATTGGRSQDENSRPRRSSKKIDRVEYIESVAYDGQRYDVWSETGGLDVDRLYVSQFAEDDVKPVLDDDVEQFIRNELE